MQAAAAAAAVVYFTGPLTTKSTKSLAPRTPTKLWKPLFLHPKALVAASPEGASAVETAESVDYNSSTSVFPAEACDTVGGDACNVDMYPEVKILEKSRVRVDAAATEEVEREYVEYNQPKTVFPAEACDDLGGEFCDPEYQSGVFK